MGAPKTKSGPPAKGGTTGKGKNQPVVPSQNVTFCVTMSLVDANNLLVAVANAINNAAAKGAKTGGGKKGKGGGK
jgi:hypothetical protein